MTASRHFPTNKVFFDASVIIAVLLSPSGGSAKLLEFAKNKAIVAITSQTVIDEVIDHTEKIHKTPEEISLFVKESGFLVRERVTQTEIEKVSGIVDSTDAHLLVGARGSACQYLVTLDKKHLLRTDVQKMVAPLRIVNPKELLGVFA
ncbi:putative toxin-antitoxin system toxin component, PIN family [Candidatus Gottesmanbacteria bacterium RIFCSPHIGHO2_01_FULL_46_14]|uniref:Putative toxin-antitoxin system toxin component, PIN family n=2 Tax=Candidatus Gottesmaniibacteriota TaxID=1752720 RepID=A0A1F5ZM63_9BACT|nr:MAG: putative toxin-antitoxin system toxin component, PIN family [Candidatus Gottesmanbacteria bacterium RIFCSPHIGHO2_01_FULL_46_14]OGG28954.1 MAG: putative toxin-antitoxin system toxin component, PIN family [Candidatus Gottesmanbacteria bacterium RIFCSPLOWO2_01_FULL_46_21]